MNKIIKALIIIILSLIILIITGAIAFVVYSVFIVS